MMCRLAYLAAGGIGAATPAMAVDGAFYRCAFDDGRVVVLAEQDGAFAWHEGSFVAPVTTEPQAMPDPILSFFGVWDDPERLDVFVGWQMDGGPDMEIGAAMISRTVISQSGELQSITTPGLCEDARS